MIRCQWHRDATRCRAAAVYVLARAPEVFTDGPGRPWPLWHRPLPGQNPARLAACPTHAALAAGYGIGQSWRLGPAGQLWPTSRLGLYGLEHPAPPPARDGGRPRLTGVSVAG